MYRQAPHKTVFLDAVQIPSLISDLLVETGKIVYLWITVSLQIHNIKLLNLVSNSTCCIFVDEIECVNIF